MNLKFKINILIIIEENFVAVFRKINRTRVSNCTFLPHQVNHILPRDLRILQNS